MTDKNKHLNLTDTAKYINIKKRTFYNMIRRGDFPVRPVPLVQPRRWRKGDLDKYLAGTYTPK